MKLQLNSVACSIACAALAIGLAAKGAPISRIHSTTISPNEQQQDAHYGPAAPTLVSHELNGSWTDHEESTSTESSIIVPRGLMPELSDLSRTHSVMPEPASGSVATSEASFTGSTQTGPSSSTGAPARIGSQSWSQADVMLRDADLQASHPPLLSKGASLMRSLPSKRYLSGFAGTGYAGTRGAVPDVQFVKLSKPYKTPKHQRVRDRKRYEQNKTIINLSAKWKRELEKAVYVEATPSQLKQRQYSQNYRRKDKLRVELEAMQHPELPKPLTKMQIQGRQRTARNKARRMESEAEEKAHDDELKLVGEPSTERLAVRIQEHQDQATSSKSQSVASQQEEQQKLSEIERLLGVE